MTRRSRDLTRRLYRRQRSGRVPTLTCGIERTLSPCTSWTGPVLFALLLLAVSAVSSKSRNQSITLPVPPAQLEGPSNLTVGAAARIPDQVTELLLSAMGDLDGSSCLEVRDPHQPAYAVQTTLEEPFQRFASARLASSMAAAGTAVAVDPRSGRILALATYNQDPGSPMAFFWRAYPAASIFKIVTAAAAIDMGLLAPDSVLVYNGGPYTLTRRNLSQKTHSWSQKVTLSEAFARSLNPVFGKIGIHLVGREPLERYASAFLFNQAPPSELPFETARLAVPEDPFGIAEIASGYNRATTLSPIQASWIAAALLEDGAAPAPWLVQAVRKEAGAQVYAHEEEIPLRVTTASVARRMRELMEDTIRRGTCRRSFSRASKYRHLRSVCFGGKTGNINDEDGTVKYDWFVGYGRSEGTDRDLVLCVLMIHVQQIGHRANRVAFDLFEKYFRPGKPM